VKISCPACSAKYSIADDKVQDRLAKIRCRKCGATIVIDGKTSPPHVYTSAGEAGEVAEPSESSGGEYSVDFGEGDQRTLPLRDLITAYNSGQVTGETYVWAEGFSDWKPLADVAEIVEALNAGSAAAPAAASPSPWDKPAAARPAAASAASAMPRTAARTASRSATADLFGGIDTAGSEDDVATSAPEQHSPIGTPSSASATGQRNESSVLFSLSALTSAAQSRPSARPSSTSNGSSSRDDSGLIDLKALTAAAMRTETTGGAPTAAPAMPHMAPISPLGVAPPLGLSSPLGQMSAPTNFDYGMPQQKSKAPLYVGGALALGLLAVAAAILLKPEPPPPPPPAVVVAAPPPANFVPTPTAEPVAKPPATGTGEEPSADSSKAAPKKRPVGGGGGGVKKPGGAAAAPGGGDAAKPAAAPVKKSGGCGCAPSDLLCNMKCSSK
jgi:predicted Zn finger-like uncharacterized protein